MKRKDGSFREEMSAVGERVKGAVKEGAGKVTGNKSLENRGKRENAEGKARERENKVLGKR